MEVFVSLGFSRGCLERTGRLNEMIEELSETFSVNFNQSFDIGIEAVLIVGLGKGLFLMKRPDRVHNAVHDFKPHLVFV